MEEIYLTYKDVKSLEIYIFLLTMYFGASKIPNLLCSTLICALSIGHLFKSCNLSVDLGKALQQMLILHVSGQIGVYIIISWENGWRFFPIHFKTAG